MFKRVSVFYTKRQLSPAKLRAVLEKNVVQNILYERGQFTLAYDTERRVSILL